MTGIDESRAEVGLIGVGRMGLPICARLAERGISVVATDLRPEARHSVLDAGGTWADSVAGLDRCRVVISVLPGPGELAQTRDALLAVLSAGSTWIDMTSATPAVGAEVSKAAASRGVRTLDAPMGGGPPQAREGRLVAFVGGESDVVDEHRELLQALAAEVVHVGPPGSGYAAKLLINLLWFGQAVAGAEVLALSVRAGLDPETIRRAVQRSAAANHFMEHDAARLMQGDDLTSFSLARCVEELEGTLELGGALGVPMAMGERIAAIYAGALEHYGDIDGELLAARFVAEQAHVSFPDLPGRPPADSG